MSHICKSNVNADNVYLALDSLDTELSVFVRGFGSARSCWPLGRPGERLAPYAAPGARAWGLLITSALDRRIRRQSHHPGRTTPLEPLAGRRAALRTEGWFCLGFASESPKYPGPL